MYIILLLLVFCGSLNAQDLGDPFSPPPPPRVLKGSEKNDAISRLRSPHAFDRMEAAYELEVSITEDDINKWLHGYDEVWYVDGIKHTRHIDKDLYPLYEILNCYWPEAANKYEEDIYKIEDKEFIYAISNILFQYKKFGYLSKNYKISFLVQDEFYLDYKERANTSWIWPTKYKYIVANKWLKDKYLSDESEWFETKAIIRFFANELTKEDIDESTLIKMLHDAKNSNKMPEIDKGRMWFRDTGYLDYSLIISFLLERKEWLQPLNDALSKVVRIDVNQVDGNPIPQFIIKDKSSKAVKLFQLSLDSKFTELKELLLPILRNTGGVNFFATHEIDLQIIIHHPWFENFRNSDGFKEWWEENQHRIKIIPPDPEFKTINWWIIGD